MFQKVKSAAKNSVVYSIANLAGKMSGVILLPIYTLYLPAAMFGLYALFEITYQVILAITGMGIKNALMRWYWDKNLEDKRKELFYTTFVFNLAVSVLTMGALYLVFDLLATYLFKSPITTELKVVFIVSTFIRLVVEMPMLLLRITHQAMAHTKYQLIQLAIFVACIAFFLIHLKMEILGIFYAFLISASVNLIMLIPYTLRNIKCHYQRSIIKEMLAFGTPLAISNLVNLLLNMSDKLTINFFSNLKAVGNYSLAAKISGIIDLMIVNAFMNAYTHIFFKGMDEQDNERFFAKTFTYLMLVLSFAGLAVILFIKDLVKLLSWGSGDYLDSIPLIPVLTLGVIFSGARAMLTLPLSKYKKTRLISIISVAAGVINLAGNIALVPYIGGMGASIATVFTQIITAFWSYYYVRKLDNTPYEIKRISIIVSSSIAFSVISLLVQPEMVLIRLLFNLLLLFSWPVLLYVCGVFEQAEIDRLKQAWAKWSNPKNWKRNIAKEIGKA